EAGSWRRGADARIRRWVTQPEWLPGVDGNLVGESLFDMFTYNAHTSLAMAKLETTHVPPPPYLLTEGAVSTGRFDLWQELSLPFYAGPVKVVPYGVLDLTYYTEDIDLNDQGRVHGGGGVRASIPFTRLYPDVESTWFNLNGINHKIVLTGNYYVAQSSVPYANLPQLDLLNDDATDQALRDLFT